MLGGEDEGTRRMTRAPEAFWPHQRLSRAFRLRTPDAPWAHQMLCDRCGAWRGKRFWRPSQWSASQSTLFPYVGCRDCHNSGPPQELVDVARDSLRLREWDLQDFGKGQAAFLSEFRTRHSCIKKLSHHGAVTAVYEFHPKHWQDPRTHVWYFDPDNSVYLAAVQFACPEFIHENRLTNEERVGDVIEAILGLEFDLAAGGHGQVLDAPYPESRVSLNQAARFWRIMVYHQFCISWLGHWRSRHRSPECRLRA